MKLLLGCWLSGAVFTNLIIRTDISNVVNFIFIEVALSVLFIY